MLTAWKADLEGLKTSLTTVDGLTGLKERLTVGKKDFEPVVAAFKDLLGCFRCEACDSWLYVTPRVNPESLRCACNAITLNLRPKPK